MIAVKPMNQISKRTIVWLAKAWPLWYVIALGFVHWTILKYAPYPAEETNKTVSLLCQLIGGLLVLLSIDSNLGVLRKENLLGAFREYLKRFPPIHKGETFAIRGDVSIKFDVQGHMTHTKTPNTVEEKLEYLQEQIKDVRTLIHESLSSVNQTTEKRYKQVEEKISETKVRLHTMEENLEIVYVGGIKLQILGVFLVVYGSLTSHIA